jgi:hypothetical protein
MYVCIYIHISRHTSQALRFKIFPSTKSQGGAFLFGASKDLQIKNHTERCLYLTFSQVENALVKKEIHAGGHAGIQGAGIHGGIRYEFVPLNPNTPQFWIKPGTSQNCPANMW